MAIKSIIKQKINTVTDRMTNKYRPKLDLKFKFLNFKFTIGMLALSSSELNVVKKIINIED